MGNENDIVSRIKLIDEMSSEVKAIRANLENNFKQINSQTKQAQGAFSDLGGEIKNNLIASVKNLVIGFGGLFAVQKVIGFFVEARNESRENAEANISLTSSLGYYSAKLVEQQEIMKKKYLIDEADLANAQARLAAYVKDDELLRKMLPAVLNLAKAKSLDLVTAAEMTGRAFASDSDEFGRYKIKIEGALGSVERGTSMVSGMNTAFGQQADKLRELQDVIDRSVFSWKQFKEAVGGAFRKSTVEETLAKYVAIVNKVKEGADLLNLPPALTAGTPLGGLSLASTVKKEYEKIEKFVNEYNTINAKNEKDSRDAANAEQIKAQNATYDKLRIENLKAQAEITGDSVAEIKKKYGILFQLAVMEFDKEKKLYQDGSREQEMVKATFRIKMASLSEQQEKDIREKSNKDVQSWEDFQAEQQKFLAEDEIDRLKAQGKEKEAVRLQNIEDVRRQTEEANRSQIEADKTLYTELKKGDEEYLKWKKEVAEEEIRIRRLSVDSAFKAGESLSRLGQLAVRESKMQANEKKNILTGMAIADAAGAAVKGIYQVWDSDATGSVWGNIAATVVVAAAVIADAWTYIDQIQSASFAKGTSFAPGGQALVGEQGPEMVNLPRGSQVLTARQTQQQMASQPQRGGDTFIFQDNSGREIERFRVALRSNEFDSVMPLFKRKLQLA